MNIVEVLRNFFFPCKNFTSLYDNIIATEKQQYYSEQGVRHFTDRNVASIDFTGMYDGDRCTYFYLIKDFPRELTLNWKKKIRNLCKDNIRVTFINVCKYHAINWESTEMRNRLRILGEISKDNADKDINAYNMHKNINAVKMQEWTEDSLLYLAEASKERGCGFYKSSIMMIVAGNRGEAFDTTIKNIEDEAQNVLGFKLHRVLYNVPSIMSIYSPFAQYTVDEAYAQTPWKVQTDEILARHNTYTQGIVGAKGVYVGTDIYSNFPVLKQFKENATDAENMLITAETGGGKSFMIKIILLQLLALGYNGTIMDVEGDEYTPIVNMLREHSNVHIVNMAEGMGKYFDPVEVPKQLGDKELDSMGFNMSSNFTKQILCILLGDLLKEDSWYNILIDEAVAQTYHSVGVEVDNPETWSNSASLKLHDVYASLKRMHNTYKKDNALVQAAIDKALTKLSVYFEPQGIKSHLFKEQIRIDEVADADLVVCSFGMKGRSENSIDPVQMALMQLSAAMFSHQRSLYSKVQHKFNFKLWEEFQRWGEFEGSDKTLGVAITGGRKLGDINIIISNHVKGLLENDRFSILDNLQSIFIGCIPDSDVRHQLLKRLDLLQFEKELGKIAKESTKKAIAGVTQDSLHVSESRYKHAFLASIDKASHSLVKISLPASISKTNLFYTGVTKVDTEENIETLLHKKQGKVEEVPKPIVEHKKTYKFSMDDLLNDTEIDTEKSPEQLLSEEFDKLQSVNKVALEKPPAESVVSEDIIFDLEDTSNDTNNPVALVKKNEGGTSGDEDSMTDLLENFDI